MDLTVAICTYKRLDPFRATLVSLAACDPIKARWELLVIDNGCDPAVERIAQEHRGVLSLRYLPESTLGTSHARNRAVREAKAPVIVFTDDDVTFDSAWLTRMAAAIRAHPECDFWGGRVEPGWEGCDRPSWFDISLCPMLGDCVVRYQQGETPRYWDVRSDPPFYTANLALRVQRVHDAGYFDTTVGHRGGVRMGMEDSLMVQAIDRMGGKGWYAADAVVHHPVTADRLTKRYARRFAWRQGWMSVKQAALEVETTSPEETARSNGGGSVAAQQPDGHTDGGLPGRRKQTRRVPRWFFRVAIEQIAAGCLRWLNGVVRLSPATRFAGQFIALFNLSKLWHALFRRSDL